MRVYGVVILSMMALLLVIFLLTESLGGEEFFAFSAFMSEPTPLAALIGMVLLASDVILPVPSSLVMAANGALFGMVTGTLLSLTGSFVAALLGFAIGRRGGQYLERHAASHDTGQATRLLQKWGILAVILTRPVPILAETMTVVAGASELSWPRFSLAALAGSLPAALLYAVAGAQLAASNFALLTVLLTLVVAGLAFAGERYWRLRTAA